MDVAPIRGFIDLIELGTFMPSTVWPFADAEVPSTLS
jgi:hypothetical protein